MKKLLYSLFIFLCPCTKAQTQLFTTEDGLSNKVITCVLQAGNGYLWVGTANGLNLYDGYTFYEYNRHNGLSNGKITCLYEDKKGLLWIGTWEGLNILNQRTGEIKKLLQKEDGKGSVLNAEITCIQPHTDGSVLVSMGNGIIFRFVNETNYKTVYVQPVPDKIYKYQIIDIKPIADSSLLILNSYGIVKRLTKAFKEDTVFFNAYETIFTMASSDTKKEVVLGDAWGNITKVSGMTGRVLQSFPAPMPRTPGNILTTSYMTDEKNVWLGHSEGQIFVSNLKTGEVINYTESVKSLVIGAPTNMYKDRSGILWIGTNYGLVKFCPRKNYFENYLFVQNGAYKSKNSMRSMIEVNNTIYAGSYNGLFTINGNTGATRHFEFKLKEGYAKKGYYPYCLLNDSNVIWIGSEIRGLYRFNKRTEQIEFPLRAMDFFKAYALLPDGDSIWIGTHHGLFIYTKKQNSIVKYCDNKDQFDISGIEIMELLKDAEGNIWIGSYASGLFKMKKGGGIIQRISNANTHNAINFISALYLEKDSLLWVGTRGGGLGKINTRSNAISFYTKKNGLADNSIAGILRDDQGILWISTFNGLSKFNPRTGTFENYYGKDGLTDNEFNSTSYLKAGNGKLYFGGLNGINAFDPQTLQNKQKQAPEIFLTHFAKYDGSSNKLVEKMLDLRGLEDIHFTHKDGFFSFSFALNDYYDPLRNTFFYRLDGLDTTWINIGTQNIIRFNSLPASDYTLKIKGINSEGHASVNELKFHISVSRAFYTTWWFYLLVLLVTIALVITITRYRIYQVLKIQKLRTKISSDLHDEVGSLLTRISIQAELIKQGISQNNTMAEVGRIADTSRQATAAMSDVLWSIDARNDKMGNLVDRLREQAGEILFPLEIGVSFTIRNIDPSKEIDNIIRQNLFLIFKEAVNNIAKHAKATNVEVLLENKAHQFVMVIEDNGVPVIKATTTRRGQGLRNMNMRAELLEGTLDINTEQGYRITLKIKKFT